MSSDNVIRWPSGVETSGWSTSTPSTAASELFDDAAALTRAERRAWLAGHPSAQHLRADVLERVFQSPPEDPEGVGRFSAAAQVPRSAAADLGAADGSYRRAVGGRVERTGHVTGVSVTRSLLLVAAGWWLRGRCVHPRS